MAGLEPYMTARSWRNDEQRSKEAHASNLATAASTRGINAAELQIKRREEDATQARDSRTQALVEQLNGGTSGSLARGAGMDLQPTGMLSSLGVSPGSSSQATAPAGQGAQSDEAIIAAIYANDPDAGEAISKQRKAAGERKKATDEAWGNQAKSIRDGGHSEEDEAEYINTWIAAGVTNKAIGEEDGDRLSDSYYQGGREAFWKAASPYMDGDKSGAEHNPQPQQMRNSETGELRWFDFGSQKDMDYLARPENSAWTKVTPKQITGTAEEVEGGNPALRDWNDTQVATMNALATIDIAGNLLQDNPDAFANVGKLAGLVSGFGAEIEALGRMAGLPIDDKSVLDITNYTSHMTNLGVDNAEMQSVMFQIALAWAGASGLGQGRALTDADVKHALEAIGARGMKTPEARKRVLDTARASLVRNFKHRYFVVHGSKKEYEGDLMGLMTSKPSPNAKAIKYLRDNDNAATIDFFNKTYGQNRAANFLGK
jgi:hypothetical protein